MMDKKAEDGRLAAKQDLTELLIDILMPPFKEELSKILEEKIFPFEQEIFQKQERLQTQSSKIARIITKHYPDNGPLLDDQLQALLDAQQEASEFAKTATVELVAVLDEQSRQAQDIQSGILGLSDGLKAGDARHVSTHNQLNQLNDMTQQGLAQLTQLSSSAMDQQMAQGETLDAVAKLDRAIGSKLNEQVQELLTHGQVMHDRGERRFGEGMTTLLRQLHAADASRAFTLEAVHGLTETSQRNLSQLTRQLLSSIETQRLAKTETLQAIEMLGTGTHRKLDEHQAELAARWQLANQTGEEHLHQQLGSLFENLRNLDKEGIRRLEKLFIVTATRNRANLEASLLEQSERLHNLVAEEGRVFQADQANCIQSIADVQLGLQELRSYSMGLRSESERNHRQVKNMLYGCAFMMFATLGALIYLVLQRH